MAYGQSHKIEYKDCVDVDTLIEIWTLDYTGEVEECEAADDPLNIDIAPMDPNIFIPVVGSGATIKLNSAVGGQFQGLYTINPLKRMIKIFKYGSENPSWLGYINTEQYSEGYSRLQDYPVTINCNDGFNALERFKYVDAEAAHYTGLESKWTIFTRIITKMGLPFQNLFFACSLTPDDVTIGEGETIFHQLKADQSNYYDEQGEPMTCRQVLEGLLSAFGLQIRWVGSTIVVYEPQMLAGESLTGNSYDDSFGFVAIDNVTLNFDISAGDINWDNEDQALNTVAGNSKQLLRFSPYSYDHAAPVIDMSDEAKWIGTPAWEMYEIEGHLDSLIYYLEPAIEVEGFELEAGKAGFSGNRANMDSDPDMYIECAYRGSGDLAFKNAASGIWLGSVRGSSILLKARVFVRTKIWENDDEADSLLVTQLLVKVAIEIGGLRPHAATFGGEYEWIESTEDFFWLAVESKGESIADRWVDVELQIPWNFPPGELVVKVFDDFEAYNNIYDRLQRIPLEPDPTGTWWSMLIPWVKDIRFQDIEFEVIDVKDPRSGGRIGKKFSTAALNDKEFIGKLNEEFLEEGPELTHVHGDGMNVADRGAVRKADNSYTTGWRKTGDTQSYLLPQLLLRSIISQYQDSLSELSGTVEADPLYGMFLFTLQDTNYLGSKKMMFAGGTYNDFKRTLNGRFLEVKQEDLTIVLE